MKINKQTRTFAKQVQVDLLALSDADLLQIIHTWIDGGVDTGVATTEAEEARLALGYVLHVEESHALSRGTLSGSAIEEGRTQWLTPAPQLLRERLTNMDVLLFVHLILPFAFQALHLTHPEWGEGATFNAHLANNLRSIATKH